MASDSIGHDNKVGGMTPKEHVLELYPTCIIQERHLKHKLDGYRIYHVGELGMFNDHVNIHGLMYVFIAKDEEEAWRNVWEAIQ